jgi:hypothetical protein
LRGARRALRRLIADSLRLRVMVGRVM